MTGPDPASGRAADFVAPVRPRRSAIPVGPLSAVVLLLASIGGLMMFIWPLLISAEPQPQQHVSDAPFVFMAILPVLVLLVLTQLGDGGMDTKALAMLGVLAAINAALRPLGAGLNGIETVFFLLILAGRVFGPGFGFLLGCTSLFASALLTAGVGPVAAVPDAGGRLDRARAPDCCRGGCSAGRSSARARSPCWPATACSPPTCSAR